MERLLPILAIVGLVLGALVAMIVSGPFFVIALAVYGIVVAVFLLLTRNMVAIVIAALAALAFIVAILGGVGGISTEEGGVDFNISIDLAGAFVLTGLALTAAGVLAAGWDELDPDWVGYVGAGALVVAAIFAFVFMDSLSTPGTWAFLVGLLMLVALWPLVLLMRGATGTTDHSETTA